MLLLKQRCLTSMTPLMKLWIGPWKIQATRYDLLDRVGLTMVALKAKSPHIEMNEQFLQKGMYTRVEIFYICKWGFEKGDMHIVITIESTTIMSSISNFHLNWFQCFFTQISTREFLILSKVGILLVLQLLSLMWGEEETTRVRNNWWLQMKESLTKMLLPWAIISN